MTVLIVIQARLGSKRLPGKVLMDLGGKPVLQHVVERCQRTGYETGVACPWQDHAALRHTPHGRFLAAHPILRPEDVLSRYAWAAQCNPSFDCIVRITADCPLVDPRLIEASVQAIRDGASYAGNTVERHWPRGCDVESFTAELLYRAHEEAVSAYDREHVTPWMQRAEVRKTALEPSVRPLDASNRWRWTLDGPEDFEWLQGLFTHYGDPSLEQAAAYSRLHPPPTDPS